MSNPNVLISVSGTATAVAASFAFEGASTMAVDGALLLVGAGTATALIVLAAGVSYYFYTRPDASGGPAQRK